MNIEELNDVLHKSCRKHRICERYENYWKDTTLSLLELIDMIKEEPVYIATLPKSNFKTVKSNFDLDLLHQNDIYIDGDDITTINTNIVYLLGDSKLNISLDSGTYIFCLYEKSELTLKAHNKANVKIFVFDSASVKVDVNSIYNGSINYFGEDTSIQANGNLMLKLRSIMELLNYNNKRLLL